MGNVTCSAKCLGVTPESCNLKSEVWVTPRTQAVGLHPAQLSARWARTAGVFQGHLQQQPHVVTGCRNSSEVGGEATAPLLLRMILGSLDDSRWQRTQEGVLGVLLI